MPKEGNALFKLIFKFKLLNHYPSLVYTRPLCCSSPLKRGFEDTERSLMDQESKTSCRVGTQGFV